MKKLFTSPVYFLLFIIIVFFSCKKMEDPIIPNKAPKANAGDDQRIVLPTESATLDGSASKDPDGKIVKYLWREVAGPSLVLQQTDTVKITVHSLIKGIYQFELMVTDDKNALDRDTVLIRVITDLNEPPFANAGPDQLIYMPANSCTLNGNGSYDPEGGNLIYQWSRISEKWAVIASANSAQTSVTDMAEGIHWFELKVTDDAGAVDKDTVTVTVALSLCALGSRPQINASVIPVGQLSMARFPKVGTAGGKIVFAGGGYYSGAGWFWVTSNADIYDINSEVWTSPHLSQEREGIATASSDNKIFFAGGGTFGGIYGNGLVDIAYDNVDIYDALSNTWSLLHLSSPRTYTAAATVGNKVFFAGGIGNDIICSNSVDIYDLTTNSWSVASLSEARAGLCAVATNDKIYFAGGFNDAGPSSKVDIYNVQTNSWSTSTLQELSGGVSGVAKGDEIFWAGQVTTQNMSIGKVEVWNTANGSITMHCLSYSRYAPIAVVKNNEVAFFMDNGWWDDYASINNQFDIYNTQTNQWSIGKLPISIASPAIIKANNSIYLAGGKVGIYNCTDKVYILNW